MIREYSKGDEYSMMRNVYSSHPDAVEILSDNTVQKKTVEDMAGPKIIACWKDFGEGRFDTFLLMAIDVTLSNVRELKKLFSDIIKKNSPKLLITHSLEDEVINRWHTFLGFTKTETVYNIDGKLFNEWVIKWE